MTTIAYRDGVLAADTQVNGCNNCPVGSLAKIGATADGHWWAFTGEAQQQEAAVRWAGGPRDGDPPKTEEGCLILISPSGAVREWWGNGWLQCAAKMHAWGSGERMARAAMMAGADPEHAIAIASLLDNDTGGEITVLHRKEAA
jgi:hypothetical protein